MRARPSLPQIYRLLNPCPHNNSCASALLFGRAVGSCAAYYYSCGKGGSTHLTPLPHSHTLIHLTISLKFLPCMSTHRFLIPQLSHRSGHGGSRRTSPMVGSMAGAGSINFSSMCQGHIRCSVAAFSASSPSPSLSEKASPSSTVVLLRSGHHGCLSATFLLLHRRSAPSEQPTFRSTAHPSGWPCHLLCRLACAQHVLLQSSPGSRLSRHPRPLCCFRSPTAVFQEPSSSFASSSLRPSGLPLALRL